MKRKDYNRKYYLANKERLNKENRERWARNRVEWLAQKKEYYQRKRADIKQKYFKDNYGLTVEQRNELATIQNNKCLICDKPESQLKRPLCVDHCHKTGRVRGLLCDKCNAGLGYFDESIDLFKKIITYLSFESDDPNF